jgi:hypothetical protein
VDKHDLERGTIFKLSLSHSNRVPLIFQSGKNNAFDNGILGGKKNNKDWNDNTGKKEDDIGGKHYYRIGGIV